MSRLHSSRLNRLHREQSGPHRTRSDRRAIRALLLNIKYSFPVTEVPVYNGDSERLLARRSRVINIRCVLRRRSLERGKSAVLLSFNFVVVWRSAALYYG